MERYLSAQVREDLERKMVFIGGPRQVGKTTLARSLIKPAASYLNWDVAEHRERILKRELPSVNAWIFDEIHKYRSWRNYLKGLYDNRKRGQKILVTGSARLDYYRYGGDSLQGRYHYLRLHPLSAAELKIKRSNDLETLFKLGGFPEPYLSGSEVQAKRWSREYRTRLLREDIASLENVQDVGNLELLALRLPELVGSPLSINSVREDLQVSHKAVKNWVEILGRVYAIFLLSPFGAPKIRAVKKERKHYHFDWSLITNEGARFENMVASHLLKWVHYEEDAKGRELELRYFRDIDGREVDFVITENSKPFRFIECKLGDEAPTRGLLYLHAKFPNVEKWQISLRGKKDFVSPEGVRVCPAVKLLEGLV